jgi:hypothetical protein
MLSFSQGQLPFDLTVLYPSVPVIFVAYIIYRCLIDSLSHIPGPVLSKISNAWKINAAWRSDMPQRNIALHRKYGPLVRIGPQAVSVDDPAALSVIYGFRDPFNKVGTTFTRFHESCN